MMLMKPRETGVWVLTLEPHWGLRGARKEIEYFFRVKPTDEKVRAITGGSRYSLTRRQCGRAYATTTYH